MKITIQYRGQLATAVGRSEEERDFEVGASVASVIELIARDASDAFREIVFDAEGQQRRTLLIAVDGEQVIDFSAPLSEEVREIALMPPIAGG